MDQEREVAGHIITKKCWVPECPRVILILKTGALIRGRFKTRRHLWSIIIRRNSRWRLFVLREMRPFVRNGRHLDTAKLSVALRVILVGQFGGFTAKSRLHSSANSSSARAIRENGELTRRNGRMDFWTCLFCYLVHSVHLFDARFLDVR